MENKQENNTEKLSYEDLRNVCAQLESKCRELAKQNFKLQQSQFLVRLDFLFKVVEKKDSFDSVFVRDCIAEIKDTMTIKSPSAEQATKKSESIVNKLSEKVNK